MKFLKSCKRVIISFASFLILWELLCYFGKYNPSLLPPPTMVFASLGQIIKDGTLFVDIAASMYRFFAGYLSAVICAVILGGILGWFKKVYAYINPVMQILRPISPMAWLPFVVLLAGIGDTPAIIIIFIAAFFPVFTSTASAIGNIEPIYFRVAANFNIRQPQLLTKIILPAAFPQIANALHIALGTAWIFLVAGEMVGCQSGLGFLIIDSRNNIRSDKLLAAILVIGFIGFILDTVIRQFEKRVYVRWGREEK
ncbi:MAG: ABC transporter permease [Termitinemataceae bacterium]|nr:MAG: ABC transporter permease [Termitinemataceae bacterium]